MGFETLLEFPVVIFTFLAALMTCYWLTSVLGVFNFDLVGDIDVDVDSEGVLPALFGTIPLTFIGYFGAIFSHISYSLIPINDGIIGTVTVTGIFFGSLILSVFIASKIVKKIRPLLNSDSALTSEDHIGKVAIVKNYDQSTKIGTANIDSGRKIVNFSMEDNASFGEKILLVEYESERFMFTAIKYN